MVPQSNDALNLSDYDYFEGSCAFLRPGSLPHPTMWLEIYFSYSSYMREPGRNSMGFKILGLKEEEIWKT